MKRHIPEAARVPILKHIRKDRRLLASNWLLNHRKNVHSQTGEDGILLQIFKRMAIPKAPRWCVEFGAWDGLRGSNTANLILNYGWNGVLIEGNEAKYNAMVKNYKGIDRAYLFNEIIDVTPGAGTNTIEAVLARTPIPEDLDMISIDIDSNDYYVWEGMKTYRPKVVVIEMNPNIPNDVVFVQDPDVTLNQGCSLRALVELGKEKGYELVAATEFNGIFVRDEFFPAMGIVDNDIDAMHLPFRDGRIFQGYDGTLFNIGLAPGRWALKGVEIEPTTFQVREKDDLMFKDAISTSLPKAET
ncbi:MAG: hypothetical protein AAGP08_16885 [Pseudomonadota bacterium]